MKKHKFPSKSNSKKSTTKVVIATLACVSIISSIIYFSNNESNIEKNIIDAHQEKIQTSIQTSEKTVSATHKVYLFYMPTCGYCHKAMGYIDANLKNKYKNVEFLYTDVSQSEGRKIYSKFRRELNIISNGVPVTVIGNKYIVGFGENTGNEFIKNIDEMIKQ